jgi:hypothetical protein
MYERILSRVEALPGVTAASAARITVLSGTWRLTDVSTDGRPIERGNALGVRANVVAYPLPSKSRLILTFPKRRARPRRICIRCPC